MLRLELCRHKPRNYQKLEVGPGTDPSLVLQRELRCHPEIGLPEILHFCVSSHSVCGTLLRQPREASTVTVLVHSGSYNKKATDRVAYKTINLLLSVLEAGSPRSGYQQGWALVRALV